jgi:hypothetical protein
MNKKFSDVLSLTVCHVTAGSSDSNGDVGNSTVFSCVHRSLFIDSTTTKWEFAKWLMDNAKYN